MAANDLLDQMDPYNGALDRPLNLQHSIVDSCLTDWLAGQNDPVESTGMSSGHTQSDGLVTVAPNSDASSSKVYCECEGPICHSLVLDADSRNTMLSRSGKSLCKEAQL